MLRQISETRSVNSLKSLNDERYLRKLSKPKFQTLQNGSDNNNFTSVISQIQDFQQIRNFNEQSSANIRQSSSSKQLEDARNFRKSSNSRERDLSNIDSKSRIQRIETDWTNIKRTLGDKSSPRLKLRYSLDGGVETPPTPSLLYARSQP